MNKSRSRPCTDHMVLDEQTTFDGRRMANKFNKHFIRHPRDINTSIPQSDSDSLNFFSNNNATIRFYYSTPDKFESIIKNMSKQGDSKDKPTNFIKLCGRLLSNELFVLFN